VLQLDRFVLGSQIIFVVPIEFSLLRSDAMVSVLGISMEMSIDEEYEIGDSPVGCQVHLSCKIYHENPKEYMSNLCSLHKCFGKNQSRPKKSKNAIECFR
jgi:hypothetical protein